MTLLLVANVSPATWGTDPGGQVRTDKDSQRQCIRLKPCVCVCRYVSHLASPTVFPHLVTFPTNHSSGSHGCSELCYFLAPLLAAHWMVCFEAPPYVAGQQRHILCPLAGELWREGHTEGEFASALTTSFSSRTTPNNKIHFSLCKTQPNRMT